MKIDPMYLIIALFLVQVVLFILLININMKYNRLKAAYTTFLKGTCLLPFVTRGVAQLAPIPAADAVR